MFEPQMSQTQVPPSPKTAKQAQSVFQDITKSEQSNNYEPSEHWSVKDPYRTQIPKDGDHWEACFRKVQKLDDEMCQGWRDEIDTMLIFAGLFSATVTAFVVESYQWLQDVDTPSDILARLQLQQMFGGVIPPDLQPSPAISSLLAAGINALWFSSLALALGCALIGILCKQWLREYLRYEDLGGRQSLPIREMRYKGLQGWHVPGIIAFLPLLLQAALVLFFVGILILLWTLQHVVAAILSIIVGAILIFLIVTSLLPVIQWRLRMFRTQCAFKSPQSWSFILATWYDTPDSTWTYYDSSMANWLDSNYLLSSLKRFYTSFSQNISAIRNLYHCISDPDSDVTPSDFTTTFNENTLWVIETLPSPRTEAFAPSDKKVIQKDIALGFLSSKLAANDLHMFHRNAEHCVRLLDDIELIRHPDFISITFRVLGQSIKSATALSYPLEWNNTVASRLITVLSSMFRDDKMPDDAVLNFWNEIFPSLRSYGSRHRYTLKPSPYSLFDDIGPWLLRRPNTELKIGGVEDCLYGMQFMAVTGEADRLRSDELEKVKSLVLTIEKLCFDDPISHPSAPQDIDFLRKSFDPSTEPRPHLYCIRRPPKDTGPRRSCQA